MNIELLKNTYAQEQGYEDWDQYFVRHFVASSTSRTSALTVLEIAMDEICIRAQKAYGEKAAENSRINGSEFSRCGCEIDRASITNPENLIR